MESKTVGILAILTIMVLVVVAVPLIQKAAGYVGIMTTTQGVVNQSVTMPANGSTTELRGQNVVGTDYIVTNASGGEVLTSGNYTISQKIGSDGQIATTLTAVAAGGYQSTSVNVSYTYEPDGYVTSSAGRAMASLIIVMSCIGLLLAVLGASRVKELMGY